MSARRLPVYLLLDTSGSMRGEPIAAVNVGLRTMIASLRQNPHALESVYFSIVTFDSQIREVLGLTALDALQLPPIDCPSSGATFLGAGLDFVCQKVEHEVQRTTAHSKGDWRPLLFVMTDGKPSDTLAYQEAIERVRASQFAAVIACAAGPKADPEPLGRLTDKVVSLDTMDSTAFASFFQWVSATVGSGGAGMDPTGSLTLPPPPAEVQVVI